MTGSDGSDERPARTLLLAALGFALLTLAVFRPTPEQLASTLPLIGRFSADALIYVWAIGHVSRSLLSNPFDLAALFDGRSFHPATDSLAWGDHMIGQAIVGLPIWLASGNPVFEFNLLLLLSYPLAALAMFWFARERVGTAAAIGAGVVFAFTPLRFDSSQWLQVLFTPFLPLALLFFGRFAARGGARDWLLWVLCWVAHCLMGMYGAVFFGVTLGALGLFAIFAAPAPSRLRVALGIAAAPLAALLLLLPTLLPYLELRSTQHFVRDFGFDTPASFLLPGPGTLSGWLLGLETPSRLGPGLAVWSLAAVGAVVSLRQRDPGERFFWRATGVGFLASLALTLAPIETLQGVPGLDMLRGTNRAFFVCLAFIALFAGAGVAWLVARAGSPRARAAAGAALVALLVVDMGLPRLERKQVPVGDAIPAVHHWLREQPGDDPVYERSSGIEGRALAQYYAGLHGKRLATGYNGFTTPGATYVSSRLESFPDEGALALMQQLGIRFVIWHLAQDERLEDLAARLPADRVTVAARFGADVVFELARGAPPAARDPLPAGSLKLPRSAWRLSASAAEQMLPAVIDGDAATAWQVVVAPGDELALTIDLGEPLPVVAIRSTPRRGHAADLVAARVEISRDGETFERALGRFEPDSLETLLASPDELRFFELRLPLPARPVRWLRIRNPEVRFFGGSFEIAEIDVLSDPD